MKRLVVPFGKAINHNQFISSLLKIFIVFLFTVAVMHLSWSHNCNYHGRLVGWLVGWLVGCFFRLDVVVVVVTITIVVVDSKCCCCCCCCCCLNCGCVLRVLSNRKTRQNLRTNESCQIYFIFYKTFVPLLGRNLPIMGQSGQFFEIHACPVRQNNMSRLCANWDQNCRILSSSSCVLFFISRDRLQLLLLLLLLLVGTLV
jgi:hypothetical protein